MMALVKAIRAVGSPMIRITTNMADSSLLLRLLEVGIL
jgi:hypothetical protein